MLDALFAEMPAIEEKKEIKPGEVIEKIRLTEIEPNKGPKPARLAALHLLSPAIIS